jgi:hypothetical protein
MKKGKMKGIIEGMEKEKYQIAKKLLGKGIPLDEIVEITGLTPRQIRENRIIFAFLFIIIINHLRSLNSCKKISFH